LSQGLIDRQGHGGSDRLEEREETSEKGRLKNETVSVPLLVLESNNGICHALRKVLWLFIVPFSRIRAMDTIFCLAYLFVYNDEVGCMQRIIENSIDRVLLVFSKRKCRNVDLKK
jgi:hypothetical protein